MYKITDELIECETSNPRNSRMIFNILYKHIVPIIEEDKMSFLHDYKSTLQEFVQTDKKSLEYEIIDEKGPAHNKIFTSVVKIDGMIYGKGTAHSKKEAEQAAAADALAKCVK